MRKRKTRSPRNKKMIVGLTGSFGSGKSTVARLFKERGAKVIDADKIARSLLKAGAGVYKKITAVFGASILDNRRRIDRKKLGKLVFNDKNLLARLNGIVHPEVMRIIKDEALCAGNRIVVIDAPLLIEAGMGRWVDKLIVVTTTRKEQLKRLRLKWHLEKEDIDKRIKAQLPLSRKVRLADFIIDNSGSIVRTKEQVKKVWENLSGGQSG